MDVNHNNYTVLKIYFKKDDNSFLHFIKFVLKTYYNNKIVFDMKASTLLALLSTTSTLCENRSAEWYTHREKRSSRGSATAMESTVTESITVLISVSFRVSIIYYH